MNTKIVLALFACALAAQEAPRKTRIVLAGDSTVTDKAGWGIGFARALPGFEVTNLAVGGSSSKDFRSRGFWKKVLAAKGDYVLIQFGHNDCPGKGPERETDPDTTYYANLSQFVDEVRENGGKPVLVTSLVRRTMSPDGKIRPDALVGYAAAVRKLGAAKQVPVIDLHTLSTNLSNEIGPKASDELGPVDANGKPDRTHLNEKGSEMIGAMVAREFEKVK